MIDSPSSAILAWLLTYLIHSSVLLGLAWALARWRSWSPVVMDVVWKTALVGGLVTASAQLALEVRPAGSISLERAAAPIATDAASPVEEHSLASVGSDADYARPSPAPTPVAPAPATTHASLPAHAIVVLAWGIIALALALGYAARRLILVGRIGDRDPVQDGRLVAELERLAHDAGLRRRVRLTSTDRISSPIALGVSEICVPESALTELDLEQQRCMLAHELAHLARHDPVWLALASTIEKVFWFQPLNRVARRQIATSAEFLCDEWAVHRTGSGVALARCLAQVAEWVQASPLGVPVAGMAEERSLLVSRVEKLLAARGSAPRSRRVLVVGAVAAVLATIAMAPGVTGRAVRASNAPDAAPDPALGLATDEAAVKPRTASDSAVVIALIARLKDESPDVRRAAANALGNLEDARAVPALVATLRDPVAEVRAAAAAALGNFHDARAVAGLSALLSDASRDVRMQAIEALSDYESGVPTQPLLRLAQDSDSEIRHAAAHALGKTKDRSAAPALATLVRDPSAEVRAAAIEALARLHDVGQASAITPALADPVVDVRRQALEAIEELRLPIAEPTLLALLRDTNADIRAKAAEIAGERSILAAIPPLRRMLDDSNEDVREHAIDALAEMADPAAHDALRAALEAKDANVRRRAAEALGDRRQ